jgi:hypothetical protein
MKTPLKVKWPLDGKFPALSGSRSVSANQRSCFAMENSLIVALLLLAVHAFSQSSKFTFGVEYAPAVTNVAHQYWRNPYETGLWPVNNFFIRTGYTLSSKFDLTSGIGFMTAREFYFFELQGQLEFKSVSSHRYHQYVVVPLGFKYKFGSFFINPEIGAGKNVANPIKNNFTYTDGSEVTGKYKDHIYDVNNFTYPIFLSFGNEMKMKSLSIAMGIRAYYSLNKISNADSSDGIIVFGPNGSHYYGFGVFGGVSF